MTPEERAYRVLDEVRTYGIALAPREALWLRNRIAHAIGLDRAAGALDRAQAAVDRLGNIE